MARTLNTGIALILLLVFGIVFLNGFFLWHQRSVRARDVCFAEDLGLQGRVAVALVFAERQAENALEALKVWEVQAPCMRKGTEQHTVLIIYGDLDMGVDSKEANAFRQYIAGSANIEACFSEVSLNARSWTRSTLSP
jgi:hypothetical protein